MPTSPLPSRRHFLQVIGTAAVTGGAVAACSSSNDPTPAAFGDVSAGNVKDVAVGTLSAISGVEAALGRDDKGLWAMTLTCTHEGCDISKGTVAYSGLACPCHGAHFDRDGNPTSGPAKSALVHFAVSVDAAGAITVHGGTQVDASARTAVS